MNTTGAQRRHTAASLLHSGRWTGDGPAFFIASVTVSSETHTVVELETTVDRPEAVPEGADPATW